MLALWKHVTRSGSTVALSTLNATMVSVCFLSHRLSSRLINISDQSSGVPSLLQTHIRQHNKTTHWHKRQKRGKKKKTSDASGTDMHTILQQERTSANIKCLKLRWCFPPFCINEWKKSNDCWEILSIWLHFGISPEEKADLVRLREP